MKCKQVEHCDVFFNEYTFKQQNEKEKYDFFLLNPTVKTHCAESSTSGDNTADTHQVLEVPNTVDNNDEEDFLRRGSYSE